MYKDTSHDKIFGKLPDAFEMRDGHRMTDCQDWNAQREFLLEKTLPLLCGGMPPKPETVNVQSTYAGAGNYLVTVGTSEKTLSFEMQILRAEKENGPVLICGDLFYCNEDVVNEAKKRGITVVKFNRCVLAGDNYRIDRNHGLYLIYPKLKFSAIAAWAWGYQRCIDALEIIGVNTENIAIAGHSRGGKTTLWAAATDERIKFIQSSCSGFAGSGCFRYEQIFDSEKVKDTDFLDPRCENLVDMLGPVPYWLGNDGKDISEFIGRENELPFDMHFMKAAVAPRYLFESISVDDIWANPRGTYITHKAAKEIFKFLGVEDHIVLSCRYGAHAHTFNDFCRFFDFIDCSLQGKTYLWDNADQMFSYMDIKELF
ncbi:MAG: hypothetical protein IJE40_02990 [Clostridia bacterium]|nr:hypothetical protein [Clostridia bacterium]